VLVKVALPSGRTKRLELPDEVKNPLGLRVLLRTESGKGLSGIVVGRAEGSPNAELVSIPDEYPLILPPSLEVARELSRHYLEPLGRVIWELLPSVFKEREEEFVYPGRSSFVGLDRVSRSVFEFVKKRGKVKLETLYSRFGSRLVRLLIERGLLVRRREWVGEREVFVSLGVSLGDALSRLRSEERRKLVLTVSELGVVGVDELEALGFRPSLVRELIRRGLLRETDAREHGAKLRPFSFFEERGDLGKREVVSGSFGFVARGLVRLALGELKRGRSVLVLVPSAEDASLLVDFLSERLGDRVVDLRAGDVRRKWFLGYEGSFVFVGGFKASFVPARLGSVVVFNELGPVRSIRGGFDIRRVGFSLSRAFGGGFLLGTPFPSVESFYLKKRGVLSLREEGRFARLRVFRRRGGVLAKETVDFLRGVEGSVLFVVLKRGYSYLYCEVCDAMAECPECGAFLRYTKEKGRVFCPVRRSHYSSVELSCPSCGGALREEGFGIERAREEVERVLGEGFEFDVVPRWGKVYDYTVILNADTLLSVPSYSARERFLGVVALALRSTRKEVVLQSAVLDEGFSRALEEGRLYELLEDELRRRREEFLPPFCRVALLESEEDISEELRERVSDRVSCVYDERRGVWSCLVRFVPSREVMSRLRELKRKGVKIILDWK